jgi:DNA-directed DNA polymerase III PolC
VPVDELKEKYSLVPKLIENAEKLLESSVLDMDLNTFKNKQTFAGDKEDDRLLLEKLAMDGCRERYGNRKDAVERVKKELKIIDSLNFSAYFLIVWDIVRYSMNRGFFHVGRGSGANSVVAYCLKITDVDPIELNLYFERFLNPKRTSPPDFDIDYSWKKREEVQDYIIKRYGGKHAALLGTIVTFQKRAVFRELGKVYGLPKHKIDGLSKGKFDIEEDILKKILEVGSRIIGMPNQRSIHAGGVIISEEPLSYYTALDMPPKGIPTTQWDMHTAELLGYEKFDILSQRGLGHIRECMETLEAKTGKEINIRDIERFKKDEKIKTLLRKGETIGCFYIESPAMRGLLKKLRCDTYLSLVAASSIIRPGVAKSGMMREYIKRFHDPSSIKYLHPVMKEQLEETFGVMVYQEDVLKVCHHFAGLDLADADVLRRAMSGKHRSKKEFQRIVEKFFSNCREKGYDEDVVKEIWRQIESFAAYSFSKAHSASYAVESYQSLFLKAHYPLEFITAVINNFGGFYRSWVYINEAKKLGADIKLPCVNKGEYLCKLHGKDIYLGFVFVSSLEHKFVNSFIAERKKGGKYLSLEDFVERNKIKREQLMLLIKSGAFRFTGKSKTALLWDASIMTGHSKTSLEYSRLFNVPLNKYSLPQLEQSLIEKAKEEIEILGFPVSLSYFDLLKTSFRGEIMADKLIDNVGKTVKMMGQLVTIKYVKTSKKEIMNLGCFIDEKGNFFDTVHFPDNLKNFPFSGYGIYLLLGVVTEEFGHPSLQIIKMARMPYKV